MTAATNSAVTNPAVTNSLERSLALLELLERTPGGLRNADLSRYLKIATSTCSYITSRLERKGYLRRDESTRNFVIGLKTVALAHGALRELGFRSMAEPVLHRLAGATGLSAGIGVLQQGHVLLVDRVESPAFVKEAADRPLKGRTRDQRDIGREMPPHTTALGKVLLAYLPADALVEELRQLVLTRRTSKTVSSKAKLMAELEKIRERGYATADGEESPGVRAVSVPIFDASRSVRAALSLNGNPREAAWHDERGLVEQMEEAAHDISRHSRFA